MRCSFQSSQKKSRASTKASGRAGIVAVQSIPKTFEFLVRQLSLLSSVPNPSICFINGSLSNKMLWGSYGFLFYLAYLSEANFSLQLFHLIESSSLLYLLLLPMLLIHFQYVGYAYYIANNLFLEEVCKF